MDREDLLLQFETRRHFFSRCGVGLGKLALLSLLSDGSIFAEPATTNPMQAKPGHFPAKAKSIIYLFMAGGPSQFELFDFKPSLQKYNNQTVPDSLMAGTRVASYEMAYRMQSSGPELIDFGKESKETLESYGAEPGMASYANNCLLARRLVERGVRFVQLYHTDWDHHADLGQPLNQVAREVDQPTAALIRDLRQRGLLDHTLVVWGRELGRTPMGEVRESGKSGRNHHIDA